MSEKDIKLKTREEMAEAITDKALETAAQLHKIYEPQWNARADVLKTIVSLSSGSIVLSVTFSSSLRALNVDLFWKYLIVFSFAMFVLSLILAFIALRIGTRLYHTQSDLFESWKDIFREYINAPSQEDFDKAYASILGRAFGPVNKNDQLTARLFRLSSVVFCLAIISLAIVGVAQLLS